MYPSAVITAKSTTCMGLLWHAGQVCANCSKYCSVDSNVIEDILQKYGLAYTRVLPPQKGYRNQSYPVVLADGTMANLILYKSESGILDKIKAANSVSDFLAGKGFPTRQTIDS